MHHVILVAGAWRSGARILFEVDRAVVDWGSSAWLDGSVEVAACVTSEAVALRDDDRCRQRCYGGGFGRSSILREADGVGGVALVRQGADHSGCHPVAELAFLGVRSADLVARDFGLVALLVATGAVGIALAGPLAHHVGDLSVAAVNGRAHDLVFPLGEDDHLAVVAAGAGHGVLDHELVGATSSLHVRVALRRHRGPQGLLDAALHRASDAADGDAAGDGLLLLFPDWCGLRGGNACTQ
mmetsp:Transcript_6400/g.18860  ORF Transcript_6400/g.18860 Transcript_6400/m.18860 type:complete len:241 (-) Transcript_6400:310-1032(-)